MMKLKVFSTLIFLFLSLAVSAQYRLSGTLISNKDSSFISDCTIYLDKGQKSTISDAKGHFSLTGITSGHHTITAINQGFRTHVSEIEIKNKDLDITIHLDPLVRQLKEVEISDKKNNLGFTRMRAVENMGIYEGKKSEVITPDQLVANTATNNARQVYSRVAGLNVWENDGAGLQLSIGARGLDPNRTSNFNVRQNGYDISADALGYPESYYTPPLEAVEKIQIVRGAASLQYGTQFGGLINFIMRKPPRDKKLELTMRQSLGSFGFSNSFLSAGGTLKKLSYYTFAQIKSGDGWRPNSHFNSKTFFSNINYQFTEKTSIGIDFTHMDYLAQQPGGLSDKMFLLNPRQSNRARNWFQVNWNLAALKFDHKFNASNEFNLRVFGLSAYRYSLGFRPNRVESIDDNSERDLIKGYFENWGAEARYLKRYNLKKVFSVFLIGTRYYHGFNHTLQGYGSKGKDADFNYLDEKNLMLSDYSFPNRNLSFFTENIFYLNEKFTVTPGIRFEYIHTKADGYYGNIVRDLAGNILATKRYPESRNNQRQFFLAGVGLSYTPVQSVNIYSNISQNYRSITFSDMRISNPSQVIDPNMQDEKGYSLDLGVRSNQTTKYSYDVSLFYLNYNNRIGEVQFYDQYNRVLRRRGNIGQAVIYGIESYAEADLLQLLFPKIENWNGILFSNLALINSTYKASQIAGIKGNEVEFVPAVNFKSGGRIGYKKLKASLQYTYLSDQFSDATNATEGGVSAVIGLIPAYSIFDLSLSYEYKRFKIESSVNNLANTMYFTRRATGYPGPGILPSDGRTLFVTLQVKI